MHLQENLALKIVGHLSLPPSAALHTTSLVLVQGHTPKHKGSECLVIRRAFSLQDTLVVKNRELEQR